MNLGGIMSHRLWPDRSSTWPELCHITARDDHASMARVMSHCQPERHSNTPVAPASGGGNGVDADFRYSPNRAATSS